MEIHKYFGLETFLKCGNVGCVNDVATVVTHWSLVRRGLYCVGLGEGANTSPPSELLPPAWNAESGQVYSLVYQESQGDDRYLMKAISADEVLIMSLLNLKTNKTADTNIVPADFIEKTDEIVFNNLEVLISKIESELLDKVIKKNTSKGNKGTDNKTTEVGPSKESDHPQDPLLVGGGRRQRVDPGLPDTGGLPNIGGADLDPLRGGIMGGGMLMDPRGRGRGMGPRWDPVGPGMGGMGGMGGVGGMGPRPRGGGGFNNFGDEMAPPDWNNMYM